MDSYTIPRRLSPMLILFGGILVASTASIMIRIAQREVSSLVIAAYRLSIATLILLPILLHRRVESIRLNRRQVGLIILSGIFLSLHFATWISSLEYTSVASSAVLVSTIPLWVAVLSPIFLKENLARTAVIGMVVALFGGVLVGISEACFLQGFGIVCPFAHEFFQGKAVIGNFLALAGALAGSAYLLVGRWLRSTLPLIVYITSVYGVAAVCLTIMALVSGQPVAGFSWMAYLAFLGLAVGPQLLGHTSINYGLRHLSAAFVSVALLGEPIGSTFLAILILKETPSVFEVLGGIIILAGIYLASREQKPAEQPEPVAQQV
jgi:drug/metabolite transporter (DMT)-like permease